MSLTKGTVGRKVEVLTNSFVVTRLPRRIYYHYDVVVVKRDAGGDKAVPNNRRVSEIVDRLQRDNPQVFETRAAFDGVKNLFMIKELGQVSTFNVNMGNPSKTSGIFSVRLTLVGHINPSDIEKLTTSRGADSPMTINNANTIALTLLQVILSQGPQLQHQFSLHAKSFYLPSNPMRLSSGIVACKGFFQSVRPTAGRVLVNVDTTTAAFYEAQDLIGAALKVLNCRDARELVRECAADQPFQKLRSFLKGIMVVTEPGKRVKRIADIVRSAGNEEFFKDDQKITVAEYWASHHNSRLRFPEIFGIKIRSGAIFPAEVCAITPGQRYKKRLSPEDTASFLKFSVSKPQDRLAQVEGAVTRNLLNYADSPWMIESGMTVDERALTVSGRALPTPRVIYGNTTMDVSSGAWNVARAMLRAPSRIKIWAMVVFDTGHDVQNKVNAFEAALMNGMRKVGMVVENQAYKELGNMHNIRESIEKCALNSVKGLPLVNGRPPKPSIVVVILPVGGNDVRREVKQWGDVIRGIPTQCVKAGKYDQERGRDQYCGNVALKINIKTGGINSYVQPSADVMNMMKESMMVGCDVTHPAPGVTTRPSVASLVASIDEGATRYRVYLDAQPPRQEMITSIASMLEAALRNYQAKRGKLPKNIFLYRDGVSEGEYWKVDDEEIKKIEELLAQIGQATKSQPPQLVFIVVGKRHHIRFFPPQRPGLDIADRSGNCKPGLVVDDGIVHSKLMDFYLQSHAGIIGTSRPSHYVVLRNGPQYSADQMQELSYALCFVYAAATRSVSIPAPVYYADKACTRAEFQFNPELRYMDDASSDGGQFDLEAWKKGLAQSILSSDMYFV